VEQTYKASMLAFSDINPNRSLGRSPRSPCAGVATGLLKTPWTRLKNRQKWHSIDTCLKHSKSQLFFILNAKVSWLNTYSTTALDMNAGQDKKRVRMQDKTKYM